MKIVGPAVAGMAVALLWQPAAAQVATVQAKQADEPLAIATFYDNNGVRADLSDQTVAIQDGMFAAQQSFFRMRSGSTDYDDQFLANAGVTYTVPGRYCISSPLVVPEHVTLDLPFGMTVCALAGSPSASYAGDPASGALVNVQQPMIVVPPGAATARLVIYASNGKESTSGVALGKNWTTSAITIAAAGTGYANGDVLTVAQPSKAPYLPAKCVVTTDGAGHVVACDQSVKDKGQQGVYALPPLLQQRYWTAANGFAGAVAAGSRGQVFDPSIAGGYVTSGGSGTGARLYLGWTPDFAGAGADYAMGAFVQGAMDIGDVYVLHAGTKNDTTYGRQFGLTCNGLQIKTGEVVTGGGYYGVKVACTDFHPASLHPIAAKVLLRFENGGSAEVPDTVLDTWDVAALQVLNYSNLHLHGTIFHNLLPAEATAAPLQINTEAVSPLTQTSSGLVLDFLIDANHAMASSAPAMSIAYTHNAKIDLRVVNTDAKTGAIVPTPLKSWANFGDGIDGTNIYQGSVDAGAQTLFTGPMPQGRYAIWDAVRHTVETGPNSIGVNALAYPQSISTGWTTIGTPARADNVSGTTAPTGGNTASQLTLNAAGQAIRQAIAGVGNQSKICAAVWIKRNGSNAVPAFTVTDHDLINFFSIGFNTDSGVFSPTQKNAGLVISYGDVAYADGWHRIWMYGLLGVTDANVQIAAYSPANTGSMYLWGATVQIDPQTCPGAPTVGFP